MNSYLPEMIWLAWLLAGLVGLPLLVLGGECLLALLPARGITGGQRRRVAVLIPAHNEAGGITRTLVTVRRQLRDDDRLVVVADNCSDQTAEVAQRAGAEVVQRHDPVNRGKSFALDAGVRYLQANAPDVVVMLDADCEAQPGMIDRLARSVDATGRPAQGLYLMRPPQTRRPDAMVSAFAFLVKNWVRPRALHRMGVPVLLTGAGMAFPWSVIRDAPLHSAEIVEDLALGLELTRRGAGATFCESARVWSELPSSDKAAVSQRTRWEHGYLSAIFREVPSLVIRALAGRPRLLVVALDLLVPPLALLALISLLVSVGVIAASVAAGSYDAAQFLLGAGALAAVGIGLSWWRFAQDLIRPSVILSIPHYVLGKIGIYRRYFGQRQYEWVRTERSA